MDDRLFIIFVNTLQQKNPAKGTWRDFCNQTAGKSVIFPLNRAVVTFNAATSLSSLNHRHWNG